MRRLLMLMPAVCLILATAACSDDDGGNDDEKAGESTSEAPSKEETKEARKRIAETSDCSAEVSTTGAHEAEWHGQGQVRTGGKSVDDPGPNAVYTLTDKGNRIALYSPGPEFKGSVSLSADGVAFSSDPADAGSLDIDKRGKSASVEVTVTSTGGDTIDVVAEFTCGTSKKQ